jgi:hypothetical protein
MYDRMKEVDGLSGADCVAGQGRYEVGQLAHPAMVTTAAKRDLCR